MTAIAEKPAASKALAANMRLLKYARPHLRLVGVVAATMAANIALELAKPWPMKILVDNVVGHRSLPGLMGTIFRSLPGPHDAAGLLGWVVFSTLVIFALGTAVAMTASVVGIKLGQRMKILLRGYGGPGHDGPYLTDSIMLLSIQPASRQAFARLLTQGWTDALRRLHPEGPLWTFWDYERDRWRANKGMRLDHFLLSPILCERLVDGGVDRWVRGEDNASDHAPAWIVLDL